MGEWMQAAMREAWMSARGWAAGLGLLAVWCGLAGWWLWMPVATGVDVALVVVVGLAAVALPGWVLWRQRRMWRAGRVYAVLPGALAAAVGLPWLLVTWVPEVGGLTAQAASAAVRFAAAGVCVVGAWRLLAAVGRQAGEEQADGTGESAE